MDGQKSGCFCSVHIVLAGLSWGGPSDHTADSIEAVRQRSQPLRDVTAHVMFARLLLDATLNRYRRSKLTFSFSLESTLAAYERGFSEFPLDKPLCAQKSAGASLPKVVGKRSGEKIPFHAACAQGARSCGRRRVRRALCPRGLQRFNKAECQRKANLNLWIEKREGTCRTVRRSDTLKHSFIAEGVCVRAPRLVKAARMCAA